jgi:hypothetical protein
VQEALKKLGSATTESSEPVAKREGEVDVRGLLCLVLAAPARWDAVAPRPRPLLYGAWSEGWRGCRAGAGGDGSASSVRGRRWEAADADDGKGSCGAGRRASLGSGCAVERSGRGD